jgi:hypothetical protein
VTRRVHWKRPADKSAGLRYRLHLAPRQHEDELSHNTPRCDLIAIIFKTNAAPADEDILGRPYVRLEKAQCPEIILALILKLRAGGVA